MRISDWSSDVCSSDLADEVKTATFFTAQVDFSECGELGVFVDEDQLKAVKELSESKGYLDGRYMAPTFNMLRANDLIWNRSEERRVGKEGVSTCRSRGSPNHSKKNNNKKK